MSEQPKIVRGMTVSAEQIARLLRLPHGVDVHKVETRVTDHSHQFTLILHAHGEEADVALAYWYNMLRIGGVDE